STERRGRRVGDAAIHGDHRIYGRWVLRRYGNACATDVAGWQSVGECGIGKSGPCPSAVHRLVDPASHAGSLHVRPALSYAVPHRCAEYLGIGRIHCEVDRASGVIDEQHLAPRRAAVRRLEAPRSAFGPHRCPSAATYTVFGSLGLMTIFAIDRVSARPMCCHLRPPFVDLCTPLPQSVERDEFFSPVPTQMMLLSDGATAMSPIDPLPSESEIGCQVIPAFEVSHTPPPAEPM